MCNTLIQKYAEQLQELAQQMRKVFSAPVVGLALVREDLGIRKPKGKK